ncbi:MAG: hypothetical protein P1R58_12670 [bacterium]|nr:hypothetical protein [bacterium]
MNDHLSDEQIQLYLDSAEELQADETGQHLESCQSCRRTYLQYQLLAGEVSRPIPTKLSGDFAAKVTKAAFAPKTGPVAEPDQSRLAAWILPVAASIGSIMIWAYFAGWDQFWATALSGFLHGYTAVTEPLSSLRESFGFLGDSTGLILAAGMLLLLFGSMDKIIRVLSRMRTTNFSII